MWIHAGQAVCALLLLFLAGGTLLNLSRHPHWFIRGWDFPRIQIAAVALLCMVAYVALNGFGNGRWAPASWQLVDWLLAGLTAALLAWHGYQIAPYTPLWPRQVVAAKHPDEHRTFRLVVSNVLMENRCYDRWMETLGEADPDIVVAAEVNDDWMKGIRPFRKRYKYEVAVPQENHYGLLLLSRLELRESEVRYIVQDDVPSIVTTVRLPSGDDVVLWAVHPRPPEPLSDEDSSHRDAELVLVARELEERKLPAVVCGDLNDVAWSATTTLFLRLSGFLDPRRGRGMFNTFHADNFLFRFPLDHVFHSNELTLRALSRLGHVGSDHFPMSITLQLEPTAQSEQPEMEESRSDSEAADETVEREEDREHESLQQGSPASEAVSGRRGKDS